MHQVVQFALLGLGAGAVYSLLAQGIVVIFRGSGVLNLAHGAFAMVAAYTFNTLHTDHGLSTVESFALAVLLVALIGIATDVLFLRRLRSSSPLSRLICTLGVLVVLQSVAVIKWGATPVFVQPILPVSAHEIFGATLTSDRLWLTGIAVGTTAVLTIGWRYTRLGWIASAVSENQRASAALGWSPGFVSATTWGVGGALAAAGGILVSPITQLSIPTLTLTVIAGLAAALVGGFRSFPLTLAGGLGLGILQSETSNYVHITGASDALPFLLILLLLVLRGSALPLRGHVFDRLPRVGSGRIDLRVLVPAIVVGVVVLSLIGSTDISTALAATFGVGTVLLSVLVVTGYAGQVSLAQFGLAGVGALTAARLMAARGWSFPVAAIAGVVVAAAVGVVFALPALRTRGVNLTVVTIGLGLATESVVFNNGGYTGGVSGTSISSLSIFGWHIEPNTHIARYSVVTFMVFCLCAIAVANLRRGRAGRRLLAVRANERAAAAAGVNVTAAKVYAFAVAGALAGIGGVLIGFSSTTLTFSGYGPLSSITAVGYSVVGGIGVVLGALFGATLSQNSLGALILNDIGSTSTVAEYLPLAGGIAVLLTLIAKPDGIAYGMGRGLVRVAERRIALLRPKTGQLAGLLDSTATVQVIAQTLEIEKLSVRYGAVDAVADVSLSVHPGEVVGLIGPNGAGKTSLMDAVTGFVRYRGSVRIGGTPVDGASPRRRARRGLVRSFQALELFEDLTVLENLLTACDPGDVASLVTDLVRPRARELPAPAVFAVQEFGLEGDLDSLPSALSYGRRRLVAVARAVASLPSVLLLDEPVAGLDENESLEIARLVRRLATEWNMGVLVIEHDMGFVMSLCDRIHVMDFGHSIAEGTADEIRNNGAAIAAYLGEDVDDTDGETVDTLVPPTYSEPISPDFRAQIADRPGSVSTVSARSGSDER